MKKLESYLDLDFKDTNVIWLNKQETLRKLIGYLGVFLPVLLPLVVFIDIGDPVPQDSISHYYYTRANPILISIVSLLAFFLLVYKGYDRRDFVVSSLAGIFALMLLIFPTSNITLECPMPAYHPSVTKLKESAFRVGLHYASAAIFLLSLAYMSYFQFTQTKHKKQRIWIYRTCGIVMVLAIAVVGIGSLLHWDKAFEDWNLTYWMETLAIEAFGISWLVKGRK